MRRRAYGLASFLFLGVGFPSGSGRVVDGFNAETAARLDQYFGAALALAAMMAVMLVGQSFLKEWFGETGVIAGATLGGFVDTHSAAISIASRCGHAAHSSP